MESIDIKEVSHKLAHTTHITNNTNKHRVTLFGHRYVITDRVYTTYETIAEILCCASILGSLYVMYCLLWTMGF